jgi:hypothetical protein
MANYKKTKKGYELFNSFRGVFGYDDDIIAICSVLARHAVTYQRIQERWCNEEMSDRKVRMLEHREELLEKRIQKLADELCAVIKEHNPEITDFERIDVLFSGDPRGATVTLEFVPPYKNADSGSPIVVKNVYL